LEDNSIWALFVLPAHEGKGIGKRLLKLATDWLFDMGASSIILSTTIGTRADRWYEMQGWSRGEVNGDGEVQYRLYKQNHQPIA
jgi:GNAT superfamily N-acetyltransferase